MGKGPLGKFQSNLVWSSLFKWRAICLLLRGDNDEAALTYCWFFFSWKTWQISSKLDTKHPCVKGTKVLINKRTIHWFFKIRQWFFPPLNWHCGVFIDLHKCLLIGTIFRWAMWSVGHFFRKKKKKKKRNPFYL